jgi:diacylglycerol kinase (ATP)
VSDTLVVWNPDAGDTGDREAQRAEIERAIAAHGVDAEVFESPSEEATARRVELALREGVGRIVTAGGDGTVRSVATLLIDRDTPLGILPLGTAMNVARSLGIPLELDDAAATLATGAVRAMDVGQVGDRPFLEVATIGLAAELLGDATAISEGRIRSALDFIARTVRYRRTRVWLDLDGSEVRHRVVSLSIANGQFTGRALRAQPEARLDDGELDVECYLGYGPVEFVRQLAKVVLGVGSGTRTVSYRARRVLVRSHHPLPVRADSMDLGTTPVEVTARRGALRVVVPST